MKRQPSEEIQRLLKTVFDDCMKEDTAVRERQIRQWRRLKLLWEGFQRTWYSEVAHDWRIWDQTADQDSDQSYYDKQINVFKAYLESIIAALSIAVPPIKCFPDDADNTLDLITAKAGDKIAQLIYRHNDVPILWLHALYIFCTEGLTAFYSYPKSSDDYGTYEEKEYDDVEEEHTISSCPICGNVISDEPTLPGQSNQPIQPNQQAQPDGNELRNQELDEFGPDDSDAALHTMLNKGLDICPSCMMQMDPFIRTEKFVTTRIVGVTTKPKTRICMEVYGGLYVKVPNYAKKQKDMPYLIFSKEDDYSMVIEEFEHLHANKKLLKQIAAKDGAGSYNQYESWGRLSPQYQGEYPENVVTVNRAWIRTAKFNILNDKEDINKLKKLYPDGVKVTFINDQFGSAENESLDDCWTIPENPLSEFIHFEPLGMSLVSIQEITNDIISLVLQTIEHGIGQTFADPAVVNFNAYQQTEVLPGSVFPATPKSGKSMNDAFHEIKTATLSGEVLPFSNQVQSLAQLVSGALPSIFGGQIEGSETASEYSMSRAQAQQRLQNTWKMFVSGWKLTFGKIIPMFINEVKDDERDVERDVNGNFINVFIRKSELEGKIGRIELDANENIPMTWAQQNDMVMKLLTNPNAKIAEILQAPENITLIHDALGLVDFYIPGEADIIKQYDEIKILLNSEPIETGDPMNPEVPSVDVDPVFDNHMVEFEICRKWIISEAGRMIKVTNEAGYRNVLLHGKAHFAIIQQMQQPPMAPDGKGAKPEGQPNPLDINQAPISGESDVQTVQ